MDARDNDQATTNDPEITSMISTNCNDLPTHNYTTMIRSRILYMHKANYDDAGRAGIITSSPRLYPASRREMYSTTPNSHFHNPPTTIQTSRTTYDPAPLPLEIFLCFRRHDRTSSLLIGLLSTMPPNNSHWTIYEMCQMLDTAESVLMPILGWRWRSGYHE